LRAREAIQDMFTSGYNHNQLPAYLHRLNPGLPRLRARNDENSNRHFLPSSLRAREAIQYRRRFRFNHHCELCEAIGLSNHDWKYPQMCNNSRRYLVERHDTIYDMNIIYCHGA